MQSINLVAQVIVFISLLDVFQCNNCCGFQLPMLVLSLKPVDQLT